MKEFFTPLKPLAIYLPRPLRDKILPATSKTLPAIMPIDYENEFTHLIRNSDTPPNPSLGAGEISEEAIHPSKIEATLETARHFGQDIIHLPAKPLGRVLIGVGIATIATAIGAKIIYDHSKRHK